MMDHKTIDVKWWHIINSYSGAFPPSDFWYNLLNHFYAVSSKEILNAKMNYEMVDYRVTDKKVY